MGPKRAKGTLSKRSRQQRRLASEASEDDEGSNRGRSAGSIRDAGGRIGEAGAARENVYFRKMDNELINKLKERRLKEIQERKDEIKQHEKAIADAKRELEELEKNLEADE
ncbi:ATPase inhibitor mai-1, mitochondrial-like [Schistocerca cancellata]|uniref:ATPase inhibitor mai-1, mitochondrial-like n=1 Tax=Schistocerca cancellata TaxID=274614 RepID=UPI0021194CB9|nr:ATPase inhibitor mai-1, mitochondrial-like [Schistocerca cancellata]